MFSLAQPEMWLKLMEDEGLTVFCGRLVWVLNNTSKRGIISAIENNPKILDSKLKRIFIKAKYLYFKVNLKNLM